MTTTITARDTMPAPSAIKLRPMLTRRSLAALGIAALTSGAAWAGHDWWTHGRFIESTNDAYVGGNVTAISPHVAGFVADIAVGDNQRVSAGQIFSVIPPENATGNFTKIVQRVAVRIALDPDDAALGAIRPGLSITARVDTHPSQPS